MLYPHGKGKYGKQAKALWDALVPDVGQAKTVQGELIRCIFRLGSDTESHGSVSASNG